MFPAWPIKYDRSDRACIRLRNPSMARSYRSVTGDNGICESRAVGTLAILGGKNTFLSGLYDYLSYYFHLYCWCRIPQEGARSRPGLSRSNACELGNGEQGRWLRKIALPVNELGDLR